ncbi:MAG: hypothetical protein ACREA9_03290 [Pyrinomonadaceae bacterium]
MRSVTAFLAWWGAVISTAVLAWDIYKWRRTGHPKLLVRANGNLQDADSNNPQKYVAMDVTNVGDKATTLALMTFRFYKTKPRRWRTQLADTRGLINPSRPTAPLPYKLDVGSRWSGLIFQTDEIEKMARTGYFFVEAEDTATQKASKFARGRLVLE